MLSPGDSQRPLRFLQEEKERETFWGQGVSLGPVHCLGAERNAWRFV